MLAFLRSCVRQKPVSCIREANPHIATIGIPIFTNDRKEIHTKFEELEWQQGLRIALGRADPSSQWVQETTAQVKLRNRYANVQPWQKSRVHLKVAQGQCDYINASPISLKDPHTGVVTTYIAAQVSLFSSCPTRHNVETKYRRVQSKQI